MRSACHRAACAGLTFFNALTLKTLGTSKMHSHPHSHLVQLHTVWPLLAPLLVPQIMTLTHCPLAYAFQEHVVLYMKIRCKHPSIRSPNSHTMSKMCTKLVWKIGAVVNGFGQPHLAQTQVG